MANEYALLNDLKTALRIPLANTDDDAELADKLEAAARMIDEDCGRRFYLDSVASARYYKPRNPSMLQVDDIADTTTVVVQTGSMYSSGWTGSTLDSSAYRFLPDNCKQDGRPAEFLERTWGMWPIQAFGQYLMVGRDVQVQVTAKWGWPAVPPSIKAANILKAMRLFRRKDSPEGIKGFSDLGVVRLSRYDSDYDQLIDSFTRNTV